MYTISPIYNDYFVLCSALSQQRLISVVQIVCMATIGNASYSKRIFVHQDQRRMNSLQTLGAVPSVHEKEGAGIQSKGSCNASAQARGCCLKNGRARAMNVINIVIVYYLFNNGISDQI